jgi:hypothetical protein
MQLAFIFDNPQRSALLALHMPALDIHARVSNVTASQCANVMVDYITQRISDNMIARQYLVGRDHERMSRWSVHFENHIYQLHTPSSITSSTSAEIVKTLRDIFAKIDARWRIAGKLFQMFCIPESDMNSGVYLDLLEAHEAMDDFSQPRRVGQHVWYTKPLSGALPHIRYTVC